MRTAAQSRPQAANNTDDHVAQIDAALPRMQMQSRILTGTSPEGTSVEAYLSDGRHQKIVVEALGETGRTISYFYFRRDSLIRAWVRWIGYKSYPRVDLKSVPPHKHLVIDPTDKILGDDTYDFVDGRLERWASFGKVNHPTRSEYAKRQADILADAQLYARFMNTPSPAGQEDGGAWACVPGPDSRCATFKPDSGL
jgi:hypothetical protein